MENLIEYATVVWKNGMIGLENLPDFPKDSDKREAGNPKPKPSSMEERGKGYIFEILKRNRWNLASTATEVGIHPTTLRRKMKRLNIETPKKTGAVMS